MPVTDQHALGRRYAQDTRDLGFRMVTATAPAPRWPKPYRYHGSGWWGDQRAFPHCVGFAWTHWLEDGPHTQSGTAPIVDPHILYHEAQQVDEWPGEDYDGTSVRAGAKILQTLGFVSSYLWAWGVQDVVDAVRDIGPVVVGTDWHRGMSEPSPDGFVRLTGPVEGGHAYLLNGVNETEGFFRIKNSWGRGWGRRGHAYITFEDVAALLDRQGEACLAIEATPGG